MIDINTENLLPLHDVPKILPTRTNGKRVHISAVYRWVQRGIRGTHLEVVRIGGTTYTSREAMQRFAIPSSGDQATSAISTSTRQRQIDTAVDRVHKLLNPDHPDCGSATGKTKNRKTRK